MGHPACRVDADTRCICFERVNFAGGTVETFRPAGETGAKVVPKGEYCTRKTVVETGLTLVTEGEASL